MVAKLHAKARVKPSVILSIAVLEIEIRANHLFTLSSSRNLVLVLIVMRWMIQPALSRVLLQIMLSHFALHYPPLKEARKLQRQQAVEKVQK